MMHRVPLRAKYPKAYDQLAKKLEEQGLHAYDVKADVLPENHSSSETLSVKFGKNFSEECRLTITQDEHFDERLSAFLDETAEACKQQAVDDYYAFMNIQPVKMR
ncbi:MAG TPA: hypothetical protein VFJ73_00830 [Bacillales bacterium]|nr:hypothetical protein [Bacillales bacterium]